MVVHRGDVWWASLPQPLGSKPGCRRPVVVVQADDFNLSRIGTVIAVILSSNLRLAHAPGNVTIPRKAGRLPRDSVVNVSQVITIDKSFLSGRAGRLTAEELELVDEGLRLVLALTN